jgi:hypothetical protein
MVVGIRVVLEIAVRVLAIIIYEGKQRNTEDATRDACWIRSSRMAA